jgi:hypothetical protein
MILDDRPVIDQLLELKPAGLAAEQAANEEALAEHNRGFYRGSRWAS